MIYILLHGAWHSSGCWRDIKSALQQQGHTVLALDLPGHGDNLMPFAEITLQTYVDYVLEKINRLESPVTLVGHSMAGAVISQVAELLPQKIARLIYIAAFIPADQASISQQANQFLTEEIKAEMIRDKANSCVGLKISPRLVDLFYAKCSPADADYAMSQLSAEPSRPHVDKLQLSEQRFGQVKKRYITCLQDKIITPEGQHKIYAGLIQDVVQINSDHSPFFSAPLGLMKALLDDGV